MYGEAGARLDFWFLIITFPLPLLTIFFFFFMIEMKLFATYAMKNCYSKRGVPAFVDGGKGRKVFAFLVLISCMPMLYILRYIFIHHSLLDD